jgi:hypothetical protein
LIFARRGHSHWLPHNHQRTNGIDGVLYDIATPASGTGEMVANGLPKVSVLLVRGTWGRGFFFRRKSATNPRWFE